MGSSQWALPLSGCDRGSTSSLCVPLLPECWSAVQGTDHLDLCGLTQRILVLLRQLSSLLSPFQHGPLFEVFKGTKRYMSFSLRTLAKFFSCQSFMLCLSACGAFSMVHLSKGPVS